MRPTKRRALTAMVAVLGLATGVAGVSCGVTERDSVTSERLAGLRTASMAARKQAQAAADWITANGFDLTAAEKDVLAQPVGDPTVLVTPSAYAEIVTRRDRLAASVAVRQAVEDQARRLGDGFTVVWTDKMDDTCKNPGYTVVGCYDSRTPEVITLATSLIDDAADDPAAAATHAVDTLLHEAAHALIFKACGDTEPPIVGDRVEHVTDTVAWIVYGMTYRAPEDDKDAYGTDTSKGDVQVAEDLLGGQCDAEASK